MEEITGFEAELKISLYRFILSSNFMLSSFAKGHVNRCSPLGFEICTHSLISLSIAVKSSVAFVEIRRLPNLKC